jgi:hypothetical protein
MYGKKDAIGGFAFGWWYWSSSEGSGMYSGGGWAQNYSVGSQVSQLKGSSCHVRAVRVF